jgi:hypothetical protein
MTAVLSLLVVVTVSLLITRVATIALTATGLSAESARFQARSAFSGSGFTTTESEQVVRHPVRRRIVMWLMLLGNAGIVAVIASFLLTFLDPGGVDLWIRFVALGAGLAILWLLANSRWVDRRVSSITMAALRRWTDLDLRDYAALLHVGSDYVVTELVVSPDDWLADRDLDTLALRREGVIVLGVQRPNGTYVGVPKGDTVIRPGDVLILYSRRGKVVDLDRRRRGRSGDQAHRASVRDQERSAGAEREADVEAAPAGRPSRTRRPARAGQPEGERQPEGKRRPGRVGRSGTP